MFYALKGAYILRLFLYTNRKQRYFTSTLSLFQTPANAFFSYLPPTLSLSHSRPHSCADKQTFSDQRRSNWKTWSAVSHLLSYLIATLELINKLGLLSFSARRLIKLIVLNLHKQISQEVNKLYENDYMVSRASLHNN